MFLVLVFSLGWAILFLLLQKFYKDDALFNRVIVATAHEFVAARCCEIIWYIEQSMKLDRLGRNVTLPQYYVMASTIGFFLYDTMVLLYNRFELTFVMHHILASLPLVTSIATSNSGVELIFSLWFCELSGPFYHFHFFIKQSKYKLSGLAIINESIFLVIFVVCRYGLAIWIIYKLYWSVKSLLIIKFSYYTFFIFNQYLFYKMCMRARYVIVSVCKGKILKHE